MKMIPLHFTIEGEFITNLAREKLFINKDMAGAIRLLRSSLMSDELNSDEQLILCLQILHGAAFIEGRSDSDDYGVTYREDIDEHPTDLSTISALISDMAAEIEQLKKKLYNKQTKFSYLADHLEDYELRNINADYYNETGEYMFSDIKIPNWMKAKNQNTGMSDMLESYLTRRNYEKTAIDNGEELEYDYGWLEPDGTWHPVEWGGHSKWAGEWLEEHMPFKDHPKIYWHIDKNGNRRHITNGDVLVYSLGWILMDSPYQGVAKPTKDPGRNITKAQKEFLYDYYVKRGRNDDANKLYEE